MLNESDSYTFQYQRKHTPEEISYALSDYEDLGFDDLPTWLQQELRFCVDNDIIPRSPTELEMWETVRDAKEHRMLNNELTINDMKNKYLKGERYHV